MNRTVEMFLTSQGLPAIQAVAVANAAAANPNHADIQRALEAQGIGPTRAAALATEIMRLPLPGATPAAIPSTPATATAPAVGSAMMQVTLPQAPALQWVLPGTSATPAAGTGGPVTAAVATTPANTGMPRWAWITALVVLGMSLIVGGATLWAASQADRRVGELPHQVGQVSRQVAGVAGDIKATRPAAESGARDSATAAKEAKEAKEEATKAADNSFASGKLLQVATGAEMGADGQWKVDRLATRKAVWAASQAAQKVAKEMRTDVIGKGDLDAFMGEVRALKAQPFTFRFEGGGVTPPAPPVVPSDPRPAAPAAASH